MFTGVLIENSNDDEDNNDYRATLRELDEQQLPDGDVTVRVSHSGMNYKDALAITGSGTIVRNFPMVPGIDLAGEVEQSDNPDYQVGDKVVLNGWGVGEKHWGGLAQKARVNGDWLVPLPDNFTAAQAMSIGTAGYTAMLCVLALERHGVTPDQGRSLSPERPAGLAAWQSPFSPSWATPWRRSPDVRKKTGTWRTSGPPKSSSGPSSLRLVSLCRKPGGRARLMWPAATHWRTSWQGRSTAVS